MQNRQTLAELNTKINNCLTAKSQGGFPFTGRLRLAEEGADICEIRRIQAHPWVSDDSDEGAFSEGNRTNQFDKANIYVGEPL